jgi:LacI family transcriptional regulator
VTRQTPTHGDQHRVTIKEIARMCGVSVQTVSRVINRRPDVSPETRAAVEAAIAQVGFQPSAVARSLVQRRSNTLGVVTAGLRYFGVAQTLNGITEESEAQGYALLLKEIEASGLDDLMPVIDFLMARRVEGIIFAAPDLGENLASLRARLPMGAPPLVFLKSEPSRAFTTILIDNYGGARAATSHLAALGRRRIAHLAGPLTWHEARDRHQGWRDAVRHARLEAGPVVEGDWTSASGVSALERILEEDPSIDGLFVGNDQMALGALKVMDRRGISVPDDIAVVGFDGMDEGEFFSPSLTTVRQPLRELGQLAVREILATVGEPSGRSPVHGLTLATELIIRESAPATGLDPTDGTERAVTPAATPAATPDVVAAERPGRSA